LGLVAEPTHLYVSHLHKDHFDAAFLGEHVSKEATVILPDFPVDHLRQELHRLGFRRFISTRNGVAEDVERVRITVIAMTAPTDGPLGDSALIVDDGVVRILNQNDSRPSDLDVVAAMGPFDGHFLQFSGAIWYPMVYRMPERAKRALGERKRANQLSRALRYAKGIDAAAVFPSAGPACFLDRELFHLNDIDGDPANIFPDQTVFLDHMKDNGLANGRLLIPGSVAENTGGEWTVTHPVPQETVESIFREKRAYLTAYADRMRPRIDAILDACPRGRIDILGALREWFEPLMEQADLTCAGINGLVVLDHGDGAVVLDFHRRRVDPWDGGDWDYRFFIERRLLESVVARHVEDWVNDLFLSCRFEAERKGGYNEYVYNFFKGLSPERLQYAEGYYSEKASPHELWECSGYRIQRRCPHLKADLSRFAEVDGDVLTCTMHGWQFELSTGRCLTSNDRRLYTQPLSSSPASHEASSEGGEAAANHDRDAGTGAAAGDRTAAG
ncbi:MAG: Rieske 2Fe-2S domain-containing protein, partial [Candidatus Dormibacteria bacterium]